ncbi:DNA polymerase III subunit delta [Pontivivens insulae]|uniref:DNA-directed DNA polymerase n=1 Tax=Pontivivens insulae TaxID=1639689 RepID=A0A2R8AEJ0_9RHOB|nr:DNA polymerase III subunit delta [Pontivivens insulae]RED11927.1 DNA polymerase III delta subunit [Pontivivens insulae]SPF30683.1 hypothetical protein POI8812_03025 [Pontivivens insulae]
MKLSARDAPGFIARPDVSRSGMLIFGADAMKVAARRKALTDALIGPDGVDEMRFDRMTGADLRSEPARLLDAIKAQGFFPGQRAVLVEEATDGLAKTFSAALDEWQQGDAFIIATAGQLTARSALRKLFEGAPNALALALYDDPPGRAEIEAAIASAGLTNVPTPAFDALSAMGRTLGPGDFAQLLEKIALYKLNDPEPLTVAEVEGLAPQTADAAIDDLIAAVANGAVPKVGVAMMRLAGQGANPTTLCIGATRHFRTLHMAAAMGGGRPEEALGRMRPPVFGPRRDAMAAQIRAWGPARLEAALSALIDTDLQLRSASRAPALSLLERAFIRVAMMRPRG